MSRNWEEATPDDVREAVRSWLLSAGWVLEREPEGEDAFWIMSFADQGQRKIVVRLMNTPNDRLLINARLQIGDDQKAAFAALPIPTRRSILWDLRMSLLTLRVGFGGIDEQPSAVLVEKSIYLDGLTKDRLIERSELVRDAILMVAWTLRRGLEESGPAGKAVWGGGTTVVQ